MKTSERTLLKGYYWNHDAIRKDMEKLQTVRDNIGNYSAEDFSAIHDWFLYHEQCILSHHHGEDDFFFPIMREKQPAFKEQLDTMEHEHVAMDVLLNTLREICTALKNGNPDAVKQFIVSANEYINLVTRHLNKEEEIVENVIKDIPEAEVRKTEEDYRKRMPQSELSKLMPWLVDAMDEKDKKFFFGVVPFFVKWIYQYSAKPKFDKRIACIK